jgi:hypothetical protein
MSIRPNKERLEAQADVWAKKIISIQELSLRYILGIYEDKWYTRLKECFIYSYFRSVLYALSDKRVAEFDGIKYGIAGHVVLYNCLLRPSFSFDYKDSTIQYVFDISDEDFSYIKKMAENFDYIYPYINDNRRFSLENSVLDRSLNSLNDSFTANEPKLENLTTKSNCILNCLKSDNFALGNSFYYGNPNDEGKWFYSHKTGKNILDLPSLFGKACFIHSADDETNGKYYETIDSDDEFYLVKYEVSALCGQTYKDYFRPRDLPLKPKK